MKEEVIKCANCGDNPDFKAPNDSQWFCCQDCYDEFYDINEADYFPSKDDLMVS